MALAPGMTQEEWQAALKAMLDNLSLEIPAFGE